MSEYVKDFIMIAIVMAVLAFSGYMMLERPDSKAAEALLGVDVGAFMLVVNKLFGK